MPHILKYGLILLSDGRFLINRKKNTTLFLLPGGKPLPGEEIIPCLVRELEEEHQCGLDLSSVKLLGIFEDVAANEPDTQLTMHVYLATLVGHPVCSSEIVEQRWFSKGDDPTLLSPILKNKVLPALLTQNII